MKFEYTHSVSFSQLMTIQMELSRTQFPKNATLSPLLITSLILSVCVFGFAVPSIYLASLVNEKFGSILGFACGAFIGFYVYNKFAEPLVTRLSAKQAKNAEDIFTSTYKINRNGIEVHEKGRFTKIEWSAITSVVQTENYISFLCKGLFYYIKRDKIGDESAQTHLINQCTQWLESAKQIS